jgi:hypothetical protein
MNENNVGTRSQPALAICEISHPLLEGDIQRVFPLHLHAERNSGAFRGLRHRLFSPCLWIPLLFHPPHPLDIQRSLEYSTWVNMAGRRSLRLLASVALAVALLLLCCTRAHARAVLLLEEPYGFFGALFPAGHNAIYLEHVCAETPLKLRRCAPGELGAVLTRANGISGYDWVAIPLIPYLYSVENVSEVPARADKRAVWRMRTQYHEAHLLRSMGEKVGVGNFLKGGWGLLVGMAYERRMYAFSFETTTEQDDALIEKMNMSRNYARFDLLYHNCSDLARLVLNIYLPHSFPRNWFLDAGITTPVQVARRLMQVASRYPGMKLVVLYIPQIPGYRRISHRNKGVTESLLTSPAIVPFAIASPIAASSLFANYLLQGGYHLIPKHPPVVVPSNLAALTPSPLAALDANRSATLSTRDMKNEEP